MDNKTKGEKKKEQIESWKIEKENTVKKGEKEWKYERQIGREMKEADEIRRLVRRDGNVRNENGRLEGRNGRDS